MLRGGCGKGAEIVIPLPVPRPRARGDLGESSSTLDTGILGWSSAVGISRARCPGRMLAIAGNRGNSGAPPPAPPGTPGKARPRLSALAPAASSLALAHLPPLPLALARVRPLPTAAAGARAVSVVPGGSARPRGGRLAGERAPGAPGARPIQAGARAGRGGAGSGGEPWLRAGWPPLRP